MAAIITAKRSAIQGRRPKWPYAIDYGGSSLAQGIIWALAFDAIPIPRSQAANGLFAVGTRFLDISRTQADGVMDAVRTGYFGWGVTAKDGVVGWQPRLSYSGIAIPASVIALVSAANDATVSIWMSGSSSLGYGASPFYLWGTSGITQYAYFTDNDCRTDVWRSTRYQFSSAPTTVAGKNDAMFNWIVSHKGSSRYKSYFDGHKVYDAASAEDIIWGATPQLNAGLGDYGQILVDPIIWDRSLGTDEAAALFDRGTRYSYLYEIGRRAYFLPAVGGSITGTAAPAEAADTSAAAGVVFTAITGAADATEAADSAAASGTVNLVITGTVGTSEASDTAVSSGVAFSTITASASVTEAADSGAASGLIVGAGEVIGTANVTEAADTGVSSGSVYGQVTASANISEASDTAAAEGIAYSTLTGTASASEATDTATAAGNVLAPGALTGAGLATEADDVIFSRGFVPLTGLNTQSEQVLRTVRASFLRSTLTHVQQGQTIGTFQGLFLHTEPDDAPMVYAPRDDVVARGIVRGDIIQAPGLDDFVVEGVRSDGAYILNIALRWHIRSS